MILIFSYSFQLAGALILLRKCFQNARRKSLYKASIPHNKPLMVENEKVTISGKILCNNATKVYLDIASFTDLAVGYMLAVVPAETTLHPLVNMLIILGITLGIIFFETKVARCVATRLYRHDICVDFTRDLLEPGDQFNEVINCDQR